MTAALAPSAVAASWYPATFVGPDPDNPAERVTLHKVRVYAAPEGLFVYSAPDVLAWHSPITPGQSKPETGYRARNGVTLRTTAGRATITPSGGCGCGAPLKRWVPSWVGRSVAWS